jgi:hypothetical protein
MPRAPDELSVTITVYSERGVRSRGDGIGGSLSVLPSQEELENLEDGQKEMLLTTLKHLHEHWSREWTAVRSDSGVAKES